MSILASDLIHSSMRLLGAIAAGETLETIELNDALVTLNQMLQSWNTEGASIYGRTRASLAVNSGTNQYTLATRPMKIESASASISGIDSPVELVDSNGWEAVPEKAATSVYVRKLYCDYGYPVATIYIWPTPRIAGTLEIWTYTQIPYFATVTATIDLPSGYEAAIRYNLAVDLASEYGRPLDPAVAALAQQFKASLMQLNAANHMQSRTSAPMQSAASDAAEQAVTQ